jgi:hypothetical protein
MHATLAAAIMELLLYLGKPYINSHPKVIQKRASRKSGLGFGIGPHRDSELQSL